MIRFEALLELVRGGGYSGSHRVGRSQPSTMERVRAAAASAVSIAASIDVLTMRVHTCARPPAAVVVVMATPRVEPARPRPVTSIREKMRQRARIVPLPQIGAVA